MSEEDKVPPCIFCRSEEAPFTTREHILPESLGGGSWALLPYGLVCDECQNRFGSRVEKEALNDWPLAHLRVMLGMPTKKGKPPWLDFWEGRLTSSLAPGLVHYEPSSPFRKAHETGSKSVFRVLARPLKPERICRLLVKMGIEVVAATSGQEAALAEKYDAARKFARWGQESAGWWYLQRDDLQAMNGYFKGGVSWADWAQNVELEVVTVAEEVDAFSLQLLCHRFFCPLESRLMAPEPGQFQEPEFRVFVL